MSNLAEFPKCLQELVSKPLLEDFDVREARRKADFDARVGGAKICEHRGRHNWLSFMPLSRKYRWQCVTCKIFYHEKPKPLVYIEPYSIQSTMSYKK